MPEEPFFFCDICFRGFNYDENGEKIGDFRAYPYVDVNALWYSFSVIQKDYIFFFKTDFFDSDTIDEQTEQRYDSEQKDGNQAEDIIKEAHGLVELAQLLQH